MSAAKRFWCKDEIALILADVTMQIADAIRQFEVNSVSCLDTRFANMTLAVVGRTNHGRDTP